MTEELGAVEEVEADVVEPVEGEHVMPTEAPEVSGEIEMVEIFHPELAGDDTSIATRESYEETWAAKGWRVVVGRDDDGALVLEAALEVSDESDAPEAEAPAYSNEYVDAGDGEQSDAEPAQ